MKTSRPPLKDCPVCRIAMQAGKSSPRAGYDTFTCRHCDLVITLGPHGESESDKDRK